MNASVGPDTSVGSRPTTGDGTTTAVEMVRKFKEAAEKVYPEPVDEEVFAEFLAELCGTAWMICDKNSFHTWVYEREEVNKFVALQTALEREDYHVKGSRLGHYVVHIYWPEYVEIEWIPGSGYSYEETKIFKLERPRGVPLGTLINMLMGR